MVQKRKIAGPTGAFQISRAGTPAKYGISPGFFKGADTQIKSAHLRHFLHGVYIIAAGWCPHHLKCTSGNDQQLYA